MRPLIRAGKVAYLPRVNFDWRGARLGLPRLMRYSSDDPFYIARNAFLDLYLDQLVSRQLGFQHLLPQSSQHPIITSRIALPEVDRNPSRRHVILRIRIPTLTNVSFEELWKIEQDEWLSFDAFRKSIQHALDAATTSAQSGTRLDDEAKRIQRELIEEPLLRLEERLRRLERIRRRKWGAYALFSGVALLVSAFAPEMTPAVIGAAGTISVLKVMETYFSDIEKDEQLSADALFWLAQLRRKTPAADSG